MSFWRDRVIDPMMDERTVREIGEQVQWISREPGAADPYVNLAALYRTQQRHDAALGLLLEAVRLDPGHAGAHLALCQIYSVSGDYVAAWRHARLAERAGEGEGVALLTRHHISE
jgi:Tfp pilus assembly protein PilF